MADPKVPTQNSDDPITFTLARSVRARRLRITVRHDGSVRVSAPSRIPHSDIEAFVAEHRDWILAHQQRFQKRREQNHEKSFRETGVFPFMGADITVRVEAPKPGAPSCELIGSELVIRGPKLTREAIARFLPEWLRYEARKYIASRITVQASDKRKYVRITSARTRWGSCSSRGTLSFSWRLMMCPREVIDYVITHEICHVDVPNHSPAFWRLVESRCPDYRAQRQWLKENGRRILQLSEF